MGADEVKQIEQQIAELEARWPAHSVPPGMWEELEELENRLKDAQEAEGAAGEDTA